MNRQQLLKNKIQESLNDLTEKFNWDNIKEKPQVGIVLGSGLGSFVDSLIDTKILSYADIKNMPVSQVPGHAGNFVYGITEAGIPVLVAQGRAHYYEGYSLEETTYYVRLMNALGVKNFVATNACGSVNLEYNQGDFMIITDHVNLPQLSPMYGISDPELGLGFTSMTHAYDLEAVEKLIQKATQENFSVPLHQGVYTWTTGPSYESKAEVKMLRTMGVDATGMSTVPEVIMAKSLGMSVNGISLITNLGSGISKDVREPAEDIAHDHVKDVAAQRAPDFAKLVNWLIETYPCAQSYTKG